MTPWCCHQGYAILSALTKKARTKPAAATIFSQLKDTPTRSTSHTDPNTGKPIIKRQLLEPWHVPTVAGFSISTMQSGQLVTSHEHWDMWEFFYILKGNATIETDDGAVQYYHASAGSFIGIPPRTKHSIFASSNTMEMMVFGVVPTVAE
eukprot:CAMPEP_0119569054 /NCGR_PEP_ID=MMETSP1352-20130426/40583_1 /TAXON_ID=265584 /ORGANISM="Stauroneis constricta, Strain CCMP1120" /LENGTH=149 /DNA_ID=CAMNT_0007618553 /DNA_START=26 /DNA_END=475 /DNA_ORIENTATION=+